MLDGCRLRITDRIDWIGLCLFRLIAVYFRVLRSLFKF